MPFYLIFDNEETIGTDLPHEYVAEDGITVYTTEDGLTPYIIEN